MTRAQRQALRERFGFACGYCGVSEASVGSELTVDHFQPTTAGGVDDVQNWVYACHACNSFKSDWWAPTPTQRVLHPLRDLPNQHFQECQDGTLEALTEPGLFHIELLHLNRAELVAHRLLQRQIAEDRERVLRLEDEARKLAAQLDALERALHES